MAKLVWDAPGDRVYQTGVSAGVLYVESTEGGGSYNTGVAWNGLISVTEKAEGAEPTDMYADNIKYLTLLSPESFKATLEAYTYPDEFAKCDGLIVRDGAYLGQQPRQRFGLVYKTKVGDANDPEIGYNIHILYGLTAAPSEKAYKSINDSPEAITFSWEISSTPAAVTNAKPVSSIVVSSRKATQSGLAALEDALFGTDTEDPYLPSPDEVITLLQFVEN